MTISLSNLRVLIAEADEQLAERLKRLLEALEVEVEWEVNGSRAADRALNDEFDILLLALDMPIFGGVDVLSLCRQRCLSTPAIALLADEDDSSCAIGFAASIKRGRMNIERLKAALLVALPS